MATENTIYTLLKNNITETLIFANQNSPRPQLPYWTMRLNVQTSLGTEEYGNSVDDNGNQNIDGVREATIQLQRIGDDSKQKVIDLKNDLQKTSVREKWHIANISLYNIGAVNDAPYLMDDDHFEKRAAMDLFVRFGERTVDAVGLIETVAIEETIDNPVGSDTVSSFNVTL